MLVCSCLFVVTPQTLLSHETLLQTLARVLKEESKRSIDLTINIVSVFFSVSNFTQFHGLVMGLQVGKRYSTFERAWNENYVWLFALFKVQNPTPCWTAVLHLMACLVFNKPCKCVAAVN